MKELSKFELAAVKRTAQNVSMQRRKKAKLESKIADLQAELDMVNTVTALKLLLSRCPVVSHQKKS